MQKTSVNVAEMHVEDLLARAEVADDVEDFTARIFEHFRHCSLAEIQAVVRAGIDLNESFQTIHAAEHPVNAAEAIARWHSGVMGMARDSYFVFFRNRYHVVQKIRNALPHHVG